MILCAAAGCAAADESETLGGRLGSLRATTSVSEELADLQASAEAEWRRRRAALSPEEAADEDRTFAEVGSWPGSLAVRWTRRGKAAGIWAPRLAIPIDAPAGASSSERAIAFVRSHSALFGLAASDELRVENEMASDGIVHVRLSQHHAGLPVLGGGASVMLDEEAAVSGLTASFVPSELLPSPIPALARDDAEGMYGEDTYDAALMYRDPDLDEEAGDPALVWRVRRGRVSPGDYDAYVDAASGRVLAQRSRLVGDSERQVFEYCTGPGAPSSRCFSNVPGRVVRSTGIHWDPPITPPHEDAACVSDAWLSMSTGPEGCLPSWWPGSTKAADDGLKATADYFLARQGLQFPTGYAMRVTTDLQPPGPETPQDVCLSAWDDPRVPDSSPPQVILGQYRTCTDVIGHEFFHGFDSLSGAIDSAAPCGGSRAIAEGMADAAGSFVEAFAGGTDWILGTGCLTCPNATWVRNSNLANPPAATAACNYHDCSATPPSTPPAPGLPPYMMAQPDHLSQYRRECGGYWNATIVGKAGWLIGREPSAGAAAHGGLYITGLGNVGSASVWSSVMASLYGSITFGALRDFGYSACAASSDPTNCYRAFDAVGLWAGDSLTTTADYPAGLTPDAPPDIVSDPTFPLTRRTLLYARNISGGQVWSRERTCPLGGSCAWGSANLIESNVPVQQVSAAATSSRTYVCYRNSTSGIWCRNRAAGSTSPWSIGPDPGGSGVAGEVSLAYFSNVLYLVYRKTDAMYWRKLVGGAWTAETAVNDGTGTVGSNTSPVLVSTLEDSATPTNNSLWIVYTRTGYLSAGNIAHVRFNPAFNDWSGGGGQLDYIADGFAYPMRTQYRLAAAAHRGRLHVVALNAGYSAYGAGSDNALWYASCAAPCTAIGGWTPMGVVEGSGSAWGANSAGLLDSGGAMSNSALHLWHRDPGGAMYRRFKVAN